MDPEQIKRQLWAIEETAKIALQSKEHALKFLEESGILKIIDDFAAAEREIDEAEKVKNSQLVLQFPA